MFLIAPFCSLRIRAVSQLGPLTQSTFVQKTDREAFRVLASSLYLEPISSDPFLVVGGRRGCQQTRKGLEICSEVPLSAVLELKSQLCRVPGKYDQTHRAGLRETSVVSQKGQQHPESAVPRKLEYVTKAALQEGLLMHTTSQKAMLW